MVFTKPGCIRPVVIPKYASFPVFIIISNYLLSSQENLRLSFAVRSN